MSDEPRCTTCDHYQPAEAEGPGECRRRSPRAYEFKPGCFRSVWPKVWGDRDWCGDWREAEPYPASEEESQR